ncbi:MULTISPECIES: carboxymuconolactone decarboxylase family protein [Pseudomonadota]|uniref:Carboxymuconolactone decarboxylase family protein n=1 Tax=Herminiimonas contaminans TaxID=1111140 RepID=A0ABS0EYP1_9BURK|nr:MULTISPECIES: carboxymuconolactone decarboxylase family protein [Pseudomonadota]MBF8179132.1 carboxymuconolactone decarboxylase family protein [Herminiimonas contaminans]MCY1150536.1 carboxymuconolactone decarboxylase family protein [Enterobacter asburiae]
MTTINVPSREEVSANNQAIFDNLKKGFGMVPNLLATMAHSENALATYVALQGAKSSLTGKAKEVVNLVVSQVNECAYCLAAHTMVGKMSGFSDADLIEIRQGYANFDSKLDALARLAKGITQSRGHVDQDLLDAFFAAGWTKENLVDTIIAIGDKTVTNYLHSSTKIPVDFPAAPPLA